MALLHRIWNDLAQDESGQDLIEYALIAGLIGAVCVATLQAFATSIQTAFTTIAAHLTAIT